MWSKDSTLVCDFSAINFRRPGKVDAPVKEITVTDTSFNQLQQIAFADTSTKVKVSNIYRVFLFSQGWGFTIWSI